MKIALPLLVVALWLAGCASRLPIDESAFLAPTAVDVRAPVTTPTPIHPMARLTPTSRPRPPPADPSPDPSVSPTATPTLGPAVVFLDPGHGGVDTGTIGTTADGTVVDEKTVALAIALRTALALRHDGLGVVLSRSDDSLPGSTSSDYTSDGTELTPDGVLADLQRRIDRANGSGARVLLSIHLNAFDDPSIGGAETFYDSSRPFSARSLRFATLVQETLIDRLRAAGYDTPDRGVTDDQDLAIESLGSLAGDYHHLVLLGPGVSGRLRPSQMPGALSEPLFLSNPPEATAAIQPAMQDLIANAYARAIEAFLREGG
ncbi:MAG: N-acetylmuramoyl-L-alanine amidase family protein [Chloroflexota bacterium]